MKLMNMASVLILIAVSLGACNPNNKTRITKWDTKNKEKGSKQEVIDFNGVNQKTKGCGKNTFLNIEKFFDIVQKRTDLKARFYTSDIALLKKSSEFSNESLPLDDLDLHSAELKGRIFWYKQNLASKSISRDLKDTIIKTPLGYILSFSQDECDTVKIVMSHGSDDESDNEIYLYDIKQKKPGYLFLERKNTQDALEFQLISTRLIMTSYMPYKRSSCEGGEEKSYLLRSTYHYEWDKDLDQKLTISGHLMNIFDNQELLGSDGVKINRAHNSKVSITPDELMIAKGRLDNSDPKLKACVEVKIP